MQNNFIQEPYANANLVLPAEGAHGPLLLGDFNSAIDPELADRYNIRTIITAADGLEHLKIDPSIHHITFKLLDSKAENIACLFQQSNSTILRGLTKGGVLVHCAAGVSRSATLVIAFLMHRNKWNFRKAIDFVRQKRSKVCPNLGFQMQLKAYQKALQKEEQLTPTKPMVVFRSRNFMPMELEATNTHSRQFNGQRGKSFPTIPQSRSISKRMAQPGQVRPGIQSRQGEQTDRKQLTQPYQPITLLKDQLAIGSLTGYRTNFKSNSKQTQVVDRFKRPFSKDEQPDIARNLAKMMFGGHLHKMNTSKLLQNQLQGMSRARRRISQLRR